ncbi:TIGR02391 family protein [Micromonospora chalcea]|uniref:TIGR02391 family protein n=1 Tax=Micromonospora chalcea TaxID=1874 RepID=UPI001656DB3A|nr:TIGR02391 family protein [Micromonospora chalcea]MBC8990889.1 TIGR02391 family protein [Micromonospora chalcea]
MPLPTAGRGSGPFARYQETVTIVRQRDGKQTRESAAALMQSDSATFPVETDLEEGDLIEKPLPTGKTKIYRVTHVTYHTQAALPAYAKRVTAAIEPAATQLAPAVLQRVEISGLHPTVSRAAGALFANGHYSRAVFEAFRAVEHAVQEATGLTESGVPLMHRVFNPQQPMIDVARHTGRNADDERKGFQFLFAGAIAGLRNPRARGEELADTRDEALECLALASLLLRRLPHP